MIGDMDIINNKRKLSFGNIGRPMRVCERSLFISQQAR